MRKTHLNKILFLVIYWTLAAVFYVSFKAAVIGGYSLIGRPFDFSISLTVAIIGTILPSAAIASFEILYFNKLLRRKPFGISLLIKTSFYLISIFIFTSIALISSYSFTLEKSLLHPEVIDSFVTYLNSPGLLMMMVFWGLAVMSGIFIIHINNYFGQGVLVNFLLGRYHSPKEEVRIFMFLDLTSSTAIAERIGDHKYSAFLKDFFYDLDEIISRTKGAVYQYVGDEVVVIWDVKDGTEKSNCIRCHSEAQKSIYEKREKYIKQYTVYPQFKAGIHLGKVIVTEVGGLKSEIAYHGDTMNTASRLCTAAKNHKDGLLISAELLSYLQNIDDSYKVESIGLVKFRGKEHDIAAFSVNAKG